LISNLAKDNTRFILMCCGCSDRFVSSKEKDDPFLSRFHLIQSHIFLGNSFSMTITIIGNGLETFLPER
jgi:hypothetical protein